MGKTLECGNAEAASQGGTNLKPYNGVTYFDLGSSGSRANGSCAGGSAVQSARLYNGVTVF